MKEEENREEAITDKYTYTRLVRQLDTVEENRQRYKELEEETLDKISRILDLPRFTLHLEIIPPREGEHEDYVHELRVSTVQIPVTLTEDSIHTLNDFVGSHDMELHPHRSELVITYTQDLDWMAEATPITGEEDLEEEDPLHDILQDDAGNMGGSSSYNGDELL